MKLLYMPEREGTLGRGLITAVPLSLAMWAGLFWLVKGLL
jgi:hypothetical protein